MKVVHKNIPATRFGGAIPVFNFVNKIGIGQIIDDMLGQKVTQAYSYSEVLLGFCMTIMTEGYRLIRAVDAGKSLSAIKGLVIPSHDTTGRVLKSLATPTEVCKYQNPKQTKKKPTIYNKNVNPKMCDLLIKTGIATGLINKNIYHTLDCDATIIPSNTKEAIYAYKYGLAYAPMGCFIGQCAVGLEMRTGNCAPQTDIVGVLDRTLTLLNNNNVLVGRVRLDGAAYNAQVTGYLDNKGLFFLIGAQFSERTHRMLQDETIWKKGKYETSKHITYNAEYTSIPFNLSRDKNVYRLVVVREHEGTHKGEALWDKKDSYYYKCVLTNDWAEEESQLINEYEDRGGFERNFDYMKNDFGWKILPFSRLNENLVYMIVCSIASNFYRGFLQFATRIEKSLKEKIRLDTFFRQFIAVTCLILDDEYQFLNTDIAYEKLI